MCVRVCVCVSRKKGEKAGDHKTDSAKMEEHTKRGRGEEEEEEEGGG